MAGVFAGVGEAWAMGLGATLAGAGIVIISKKSLKLGRCIEKWQADNQLQGWKQTASKVGQIALLSIALTTASLGTVLILGGAATQILIGFSFFDPILLPLSGPVIALGAYEFIGGTHVIAESIRELSKGIFGYKLA